MSAGGKAMDAIRGMKFMQRKEEAKRREVLEQLKQATPQAGDGKGNMERTAQIRFDESTSIPHISLGRKGFQVAKPEPQPALEQSAPTVGTHETDIYPTNNRYHDGGESARARKPAADSRNYDRGDRQERQTRDTRRTSDRHQTQSSQVGERERRDARKRGRESDSDGNPYDAL
jgi:hypothetical protein